MGGTVMRGAWGWEAEWGRGGSPGAQKRAYLIRGGVQAERQAPPGALPVLPDLGHQAAGGDGGAVGGAVEAQVVCERAHRAHHIVQIV